MLPGAGEETLALDFKRAARLRWRPARDVPGNIGGRALGALAWDEMER